MSLPRTLSFSGGIEYCVGAQQYTKHSEQLPDGVVAHSFNQWQACLYDSSQLNLLLCKPLPEPLFAW